MTSIIKILQILGLIFLLFLLQECSIEIKYRIVGKSPALSGVIIAYDFSTGQTGKIVAQASLDSGRFSIDIPESSPIVLIKLVNYTLYDFVEERFVESGEDETLETIVFLPPPSDNYNLNSATTMATALSKFKISLANNANQDDLRAIIKGSFQILDRHFGGIDILNSSPDPLMIPERTLTAEIKYGMIEYSMIELGRYYSDTYGLELSPSKLIKTIYEDIVQDGFVDGMTRDEPTVLGLLDIKDSILKAHLALSASKIIRNSSLNKSGISLEQSWDFLNNLSLSKSELFRHDIEPFPFDLVPPKINCTQPAAGNTYTGNFSIDCSATDISPGIGNIYAWLNGTALENLSSDKDRFYSIINAQNIPGTSALLEVRAIDKTGNEANESITVSINN